MKAVDVFGFENIVVGGGRVVGQTKNFFKEKKDWSIFKDKILDYYLTPYIAKIVRTGKPLIIFDCFAGKGKFDNGEKGVMDFSKYLNRGGVFKSFKDITFFRNFEVNTELGILTWQNEIDIAPETLYTETTGNPLPDWMEVNKPNKSLPRTARKGARLR